MDGKINTAESEYWVNRSRSWSDGRAAALQRYRRPCRGLVVRGEGVEGDGGCDDCDQSLEVAKLGGCSCYGELHACLATRPEAHALGP